MRRREDRGSRAKEEGGAALGRRCFLIASALVLACLGSCTFAAENTGLNEPQRVVQQISDELRRVLRKDRRLLETDPAYVHRLVDELFLPNVDYSRVLAIVLGPYWKKATPAQRDAFGDEFKALLINTYATAVNELSEWEIRYLPLKLRRGEKDALVRTQVLYPGGKPIDVDYRMREKGGRWLAYDIKVAGISLLVNYRSTFVRMARKKGIDRLIEDLATRNASRRGSSPHRPE
jgi:phospholipid transport system substrate-binding protein